MKTLGWFFEHGSVGYLNQKRTLLNGDYQVRLREGSAYVWLDLTFPFEKRSMNPYPKFSLRTYTRSTKNVPVNRMYMTDSYDINHWVYLNYKTVYTCSQAIEGLIRAVEQEMK